MTDRTTYWREYKRKRRKQAVKGGYCCKCIKGRPQKGYATCRKCIDADLARYYARKA